MKQNPNPKDTIQPAGRPVALVTGASSGIGRELARLLAADAYDLVLVARNNEKLHELAAELNAAHGINARVLVKDLSNPAAPLEIFNELQSSGITVDVLVNNAGYGANGLFAESDAARQLGIIQVNVSSLVHLTRLFLPPMIQRGHGRVLNVASIAAFQPGPYMSVYYASKSMVLSFSQAIARELRGTGVSVTALCPGPTRTEFFDRASMRLPGFIRAGMMDAAAVARVGYKAMKRGRRVAIAGLFNRFSVFMVCRFMPTRWTTAIAGKVNKTRG